ncbi:unnamed protein product [Auanema sp. JU1783]|nr:unnamed protein product [Auanema sp. JU1783]
MEVNGTVVHLVPLPMTFATLTLSLFGFFGNLLIVLSAVISKSLQSRCQICIAILAGADMIVCAYLVQLRVLMLNGYYMIPNSFCFLSSIHGLFFLNIQSGMGVVLGVDRVLAVSFPLKYGKISPFIYILMVIIVIIYATVLTLLGFFDMNDSIIPICLPPTAYSPKSRLIWIGASFFLAVVVIIVYGIAHIMCHRMKAKYTQEPSIVRVRRLLYSLSLVVGVYFSTWFLTVLALMCTQFLPMSISLVQLINQQLAWLVIINSSTNFLIYFWRSPEYRKAFMYLLSIGFAPHPSGLDTRVRTLPSNQSSNSRL